MKKRTYRPKPKIYAITVIFSGSDYHLSSIRRILADEKGGVYYVGGGTDLRTGEREMEYELSLDVLQEVLSRIEPDAMRVKIRVKDL